MRLWLIKRQKMNYKEMPFLGSPTRMGSYTGMLILPRTIGSRGWRRVTGLWGSEAAHRPPEGSSDPGKGLLSMQIRK